MSYRILMTESFYPHTKAEADESGRGATVDLLVDEIDVPTLLESIAIACRMARDRREQREVRDQKDAAMLRAVGLPYSVATHRTRSAPVEEAPRPTDAPFDEVARIGQEFVERANRAGFREHGERGREVEVPVRDVPVQTPAEDLAPL